MSDPADDPDGAAMRRLRDGDDLALNEIMARWEARVTGFLVRLTGNASVAPDLAEETFVRVYQNRSAYRDQGTFAAWLFAIATNLARHHARWQARHPAVSLDDEDRAGRRFHDAIDKRPSPDQSVDAGERAEAVRAAVESLPQDLREAVVLFEYEDLSHQEIAHISGCSPKAVETRLYRARAILREKLVRWLPA